ncbi:hypothetical protein [Nitrobacter hamburgensis]|uniref:hypothetical protein n=1 Tax=Nitrobacter hamburgensis TaxID=912 RepID=UPI00059C174A|nr:hypothetical protein [Nitrobacter hamburgensis]
MPNENKIARARELIAERDRIDAELDGLFSGASIAKRGRPRKEALNGHGDTGTIEASESQYPA